MVLEYLLDFVKYLEKKSSNCVVFEIEMNLEERNRIHKT